MSGDLAAPLEKVSAWQRWEMASFDGARGLAAGRGPSAPAQAQPEVVLPSAEQIAQIEEQARHEGFKSGFHEGKAKAAAEASRLRQIADALATEVQRTDERVAAEVLNLALAVARQVLRQSVALQPALVLSAIQDVLSQLPLAPQRARLVVHPDDAPTVREALGDRLGADGWQLAQSNQMQRGGCRLEATECEIDASLDLRWKRVVEALGAEHAWLDP